MFAARSIRATAVPVSVMLARRGASSVGLHARSIRTAFGPPQLRTPLGGIVTWSARTMVVPTFRVGGFTAARRMFSSSSQSSKESEGLIATYMRWLNERPILTKSITSGVIALLGDVACQLATEDSFSVRRCFNMTLLGVALVGPGLHYWYGALLRWIPGSSTGSVLARLALDQTVWAPVFIAVFFSSMSILQGKPEEIIPNLKQNVWAAMLVNWKLWPAANFINFKFVPPQLQVLFANFVALIWNFYLSWATSRQVDVSDRAIEQ